MNTLNRFQKTKIKMVMKLRGLTRVAAIKALELDKSRDEADDSEPKRSTTRKSQRITAKEFFGDLDDDDNFMSAEEFFKS